MRNIIQPPEALHLDSELQNIRYTHTWKKNSADNSKAAHSGVKNYAL